MSVTLFEYDGGEVTNTESQGIIAYYDTNGDGTLDSDELARLEEDILSGEAYLDQAAATYVWLTSSGTYFDWVYAPDATFIEENPGTTDDLTLAAMSYWGQTTGQTIAYDNYITFLEESGLADTTGLNIEIQDFLDQFVNDDMAGEDYDGDGTISDSFFDPEFFKEISVSFFSIGWSGLPLALLVPYQIQPATIETNDAITDVMLGYSKEVDGWLDDLGDVDPEALDSQVQIQEISTRISTAQSAMQSLVNLYDFVNEIPNLISQAAANRISDDFQTLDAIANM